jgi:hypothetical protein
MANALHRPDGLADSLARAHGQRRTKKAPTTRGACGPRIPLHGADIEGHSEAAKVGQPGRLSGDGEMAYGNDGMLNPDYK